jgi:hypothetical protein
MAIIIQKDISESHAQNATKSENEKWMNNADDACPYPLVKLH